MEDGGVGVDVVAAMARGLGEGRKVDGVGLDQDAVDELWRHAAKVRITPQTSHLRATQTTDLGG